MLTVSNLNQHYGSSHTLHDISFTLEPQDCLVVMGRNGVGKTTLVETIMGFHRASSGSIVYQGRDIVGLSTRARARMQLGLVPQRRRIFPLLTVTENLCTGLPVRGAKQIPAFIYEIFPVLKEMGWRLGGDLSGGQQQQLAIARALVIDPQVLILDEPCEGIQPNLVQDICQVIVDLRQKYGLTVLLVEQKLPIAQHVGNRFIIMDRGYHVAQGQMQQLDDQLIEQFLCV